MSTSARYWRGIPQRYRLEANKCKKCGQTSFPPRLVCPACGSREFEATKLPQTGTLLTYTVIRVAPSQFVDEAPYAVGVVELDGGTRITSQITDCSLDAIRIGQKMKVEFRRIRAEGLSGIICYGYKCAPVAVQ
ncbi:Zn-ribbon domain-containing OB-fold protein [bacterium]|nr:Zn-ribbon domain-containing OB-fold protein [bacterium]MCK4598041.1 Zn-ribbon domain-containing OB-fold protein [bacterium]